ncbi:hypothetical protein CCACVL1_26965 [Corchorus capsularis]|uniref:Uncharacterized protein n=1 Tax=Corchorus capsularis TaxID=210143 RepID=A0A1R3GCP2_COCAP|nr:hypothetical protein CCACVL1_26965 [Corchorus capsularis]
MAMRLFQQSFGQFQIRRRSPAANSDKHITQAVSKPGSFNSVVYLTVGNAFNAFCSTPAFSNLAAATTPERFRAHLTIQNNPKADIKLHMRTNSKMTTFESKPVFMARVFC